MPTKYAIGSLEIARINDELLAVVVRVVAGCLAPFAIGYLAFGLVFASVYRPGVPPTRALTELLVGLLTTLPLHLAIAGLVAPLLIAIASLIGWRHVLARGRLGALVALVRAAWSRSRRELLRIDSAVLPVNAIDRLAPPTPPMVDQLRRSLAIAPTAPPRAMALRGRGSMSTHSHISRRAA